MGTKPDGERTPPKPKTPTNLFELPLVVQAGQSARLGTHLEVGRQFYNAMLSAGEPRLRRRRADSAWQAACAIPRTHTQERRAAFAALREQYAFHELARKLRVSWLAEHLDAVLAQRLSTRAYRALNRVCLGKTTCVRFKSKGRGLDSIENKRNDTGMRFVLQTQDQGRPHGFLLWHNDQLEALIDWDDPVERFGLAHQVKYARLVRRRASSPRAQGADSEGKRYCVQLVLTGVLHHKPKHTVGTDTIGLDLGPSSTAIVPRQAEAGLEPLCAELRPDARAIRRLQRKMERQRRTADPAHYDEQGRPRKRGKGAHRWKQSRGYQESLRRKAARECRLAAHRKSLHGRLAHQIVAVSHSIITEKLSYTGWQKRYGRSVGRCAPGMLIDHLRRTGPRTGGTLHEVPTRSTRLSHYCHGCGTFVNKPLWQRWQKSGLWHRAGAARPVLGESFRISRSSRRSHPLVCPVCHSPLKVPGWAGRCACWQHTSEPLNARMRGRSCADRMGIPRAGARLPQSQSDPHKSQLSCSGEEEWKRGSTALTPRACTGGVVRTLVYSQAPPHRMRGLVKRTDLPSGNQRG